MSQEQIQQLEKEVQILKIRCFDAEENLKGQQQLTSNLFEQVCSIAGVNTEEVKGLDDFFSKIEAVIKDKE